MNVRVAGRFPPVFPPIFCIFIDHLMFCYFTLVKDPACFHAVYAVICTHLSVCNLFCVNMYILKSGTNKKYHYYYYWAIALKMLPAWAPPNQLFYFLNNYNIFNKATEIFTFIPWMNKWINDFDPKELWLERRPFICCNFFCPAM